MAGGLVYTYQQYDHLGRIVLTSAPFFDGDPIIETGFTYDALNRLWRASYADSTERTTTYNGLTQTTMNREDQSHTKTYNGAGWVMQVIDNAQIPVDYTIHFLEILKPLWLTMIKLQR